MIKYFAVNEEIEQTIKMIRRDIMLSMNGICAEMLNNSGLKYKQNYGVSLTRLKEIAEKYAKNYLLSERLWLMSIRETKILATMLCPPDDMNEKRIWEWMDGVETVEMAEIISFELLRKNHRLKTEILKMECSENKLWRITAYHTLARITGILDNEEKKAALNNVTKKDMDNISALRAIETLTFNIQLQ